MKTLFDEELHTGDTVLAITTERTGSSTKSRTFTIGVIGERFRKVDVELHLIWIESSFGEVKTPRFVSTIIKKMSQDDLARFHYGIGKFLNKNVSTKTM